MRNAAMYARRWLERVWSWLVLLFDAERRALILRARRDLNAQRDRARRRHADEAERARNAWCANNMGNGFSKPWRKVARGYFWKLDHGASDGAGRRMWRLYRVPV